MKKLYLLIFGALAFSLHAQNIPDLGSDSLLEVGNWNLEWFGSKNGGPADDKLQLDNVQSVIHQTDLDIWGLCEISDSAAWDSLQARLPQYAAVNCEWYQSQRIALLYKKNQFRFLYQKHPLLAYSYDFSSGRLPLEVGLETQYGGITDTLVVLVIHMKANVGNDAEKLSSWQRRKNAGQALRSYILSMGANRKCMVIGDYNDDLDSSIFTGYGSSYEAWVGDSAQFLFPTLELSRAGERSMASYTDVIDHQCAYGRFRNDYVNESARVLYLNNHISNYSQSTSDHYPVYAVYKPTRSPYAGVMETSLEIPNVYFDGKRMVVSDPGRFEITGILDLQGRRVSVVSAGSIYEVCLKGPSGHVKVRVFATPE